MKKIIVAAAIVLSGISYAQKDELKALKKIYDKDTPSVSDVTEYKGLLSKLEPLATDEATQVYYKFYKGYTPGIEMQASGMQPSAAQLSKLFSAKAISDMAAGYRGMLDYEMKTGKKVFTDDINEDLKMMGPVLINVAMSLASAKKDAEASAILYALYQMDPKNQDNLFYAASYAVNAHDYDKALQYYQELKTLNYTGEGTSYYAVNKANKVEEYFTNRAQRDSYIKLGSHEKPREEKIPSKKGEVTKNIALLLMEKGRNEEAKQAFADARKANPEDNSLLISEANLYLALNDSETYSKKVNEALQNEPNNPDLYFNLGVVSANANKLDVAEGYYKKAIEIDPNYFNAYLNLAELKMRSDKKYLDEMNKLGTSDKDLKRYEVIKTERNKNFTSILPILEKAVELKPDNEDARKTLLSLYNALEMTDKYKALKAKM